MNNPSTSDDKTQKLQKESSASSSNQNNEEYQIGDIVWAKIGKYPYWPSIVCLDPDSKTYMIGSPKDIKKFSLHVRFCYDNGRRNWAKNLLNYTGKDDLLQKYPNGLSFIKNNKKQMNIWNLAVNEAEKWLKFDRAERWIQFSKTYNIKSPPPSPIKLPECKPSTSGTTSSSSQHGSITTNEDDLTKHVLGNHTTTGNLPAKVIKRRKIIPKRKTKPFVFDYKYPEESFHIDVNDHEHLVPTHPHRKVLERIIRDVEKLEEEGIKKVKEWQASRLAKAASTSITNKPLKIKK